MTYTAIIPVEIEVEITVTEGQAEDGTVSSYDWSDKAVLAAANKAIEEAIKKYPEEIHDQA